MIFSEEDLLEIFSADEIATAKSHVDQTSTPNVQREGEVISSLVRTQAAPAKPFRVYIRVLSTPRGGVEFHGECSCRTGRNCSHVLLVLLAALAAETSAGTTAVTGHAASISGSRHSVPGPQLIYILDQADSLGWAGALKVSLYTARRLAAGGFGRTAAFRVSEAVLRQPPGFIDANDREILNLLPRDGDGATVPLPASARGLAILEHVLASGRCFHQAPSATPLALGETRQATADWTLDEPGNQSFTLRCDSPATTLFLRPAPCYLDQASHTVGRLKTALPDSVLSTLADLPPIAPEAVAQTRAHLALQFPGLPLPELAELTIESVDPAQPVPRLRLYRPDAAAPLRGDLSFDYGGITLARDSGTRFRRGYRVFDVKRNAGWEEHCRARLAQAGLSPEITDPRWTFTTSVGPAHEQRFLLLELPRLLSEGWNVETATDLGIRIAEADGWYGELMHGPTQDWFELDLGISIDGERIPLLPALVTLIEAMPELLSRQALAALDGETRIHAPLADGRLIPLPVKKLRRALETLVELVEPDALNKSGRMVMNRWQAASLAELDADDDAAGWRWDGDEHWRELADRLRRIDAIPAVAPPQGLNATLRPYQQHGLDWLQFLSEFGFAGILADDMGLGKTLQTLAHILLEKERGRSSAPCLIVAPTSLLYNWRSEAKRFAPDLKTLILHGPQRREAFDRIARHDLVITSYGLLLRDEAEHTRQHYHLLVLDEAQTIKNAAAKISQAARRVNAAHKLCLSGTPLENHLGELWSLFDFLMPGFLGGEARFNRLFRTPIEKDGDRQCGELLARRLRPYLLRRSKALVAPELPPRSDIVRTTALQGGQRELYESVRLAMQKKVREAVEKSGLARSSITILDALLKLRQTCCDPRLVKLDSARDVRESAKLQLLMDMLPEMIEEGRRILLFSQFTSMLELIQAELNAANIGYVTLTGKTQDRAAVIDRFQNGAAPLFLISLKAGGSGLNLTAADTVIHYDPWWNPAVEAQASARVHRIGQDNPVFVYKLITEGTVEEKIQQLQQRKKALADALYDGKGNAAPHWSEEDIDNLFQPL